MQKGILQAIEAKITDSILKCVEHLRMPKNILIFLKYEEGVSVNIDRSEKS